MHEENFPSSWLVKDLVEKEERRRKEDKKIREEVKRKEKRKGNDMGRKKRTRR